LILPAWYPRPESPVDGIFIQDQAQCLARTFDVHVLVPRFVGWRDAWRGRWGPALSIERQDNVTVWRTRHVQMLPARVRTKPWGRPLSPAEAHARQYRAAILQGFKRLLKQRDKPDILHAHVVLPAGWTAAELGRRYGIPVVLTEHSGPFVVHMRTAGQRQMVRQAFGGVQCTLAVSPYLGGIMKEFWPGLEVGVLGNVVRTDFFTPGPAARRKQRFVFFLAALLYEAKGVQYALLALQELIRRGLAGVELVIGGDGPHRSELETMVRQLDLAAHCRFLGILDRVGIREQMRQCDAFVLPSLGETFCLVLAEAMACGKPVISTRCGGPEFVVPAEAGILVDTEEVSPLADAMGELVTGRRTFDASAIRASVVRRFGEEAFVENVARIYEEIWHRPQRAAA
jgi:glycosyltransferase involved in cell wall biosynthesis